MGEWLRVQYWRKTLTGRLKLVEEMRPRDRRDWDGVPRPEVDVRTAILMGKTKEVEKK